MNRPQDIFTDGQMVALPRGEARVRVRDLGPLKITSRKLVACDPLVYAETPPFDTILPEGDYAVDVSVLEMPSGDCRVGFARLRVTSGEPSWWQNAAPEGERLSDLKPGERFGYGVDTGTGCFADAFALRAFEARLEPASEEMIEALERTYEKTWSWANMRCGRNGENIIAFSSGWGDGFYPSFWGHAADGTLLCLVTDFGICEVAWSP